MIPLISIDMNKSTVRMQNLTRYMIVINKFNQIQRKQMCNDVKNKII